MTYAEKLTGMMVDVAKELLGEPNKGLSDFRKGELRYGSKGSIEVNTVEGWFHDYESKVKGGVLDLVKHKAGAQDDAAAFKWLEDKGIKEKSDREFVFYEYADEHGEILYKIRRNPEGYKWGRFTQFGPDGKGGFRKGKGCMQGVRRVPYRLPEMLASDPSEIIFICEGEKDADRLARAGLISTSNSEGADKFKPEFACHFEGRRVIVLEDNDEAGRKHAVDVLAKLSGAAAEVAILRLPDLPEKGDVSDWLNAGGTIDQLHNLAQSALARRARDPEPEAPAKPAKKFAFESGTSASALMDMQFAPIRYVVDGYLAEGVTVFAGAPKIGKSWMVLGMALSVASGQPAFGSIPCQQGDVLYLALEDNPRRLKSRMQKMGVRQAPERLTFCTSWPSLDDGAVGEVEAWINSVERPTMVIVDVLAKIRPAANGRDSAYDADYRVLIGLQELAGKHGLAIVAVHHTRKMEADDPFDSVSGTRGLTGAADSVLVLKRDIGTGRTVLYGRGRDIEEIETAFDFNRDNATWNILGAAADLAKTDERQGIRDVLKNAPNPLNAREISDLMGKSYENVRKTLTRMAHSGEVEKTGRGLYTCPNGPNVPIDPHKTPDWDNGTHGTGFCGPNDDDGWIGETPQQTADRLKRRW